MGDRTIGLAVAQRKGHIASSTINDPIRIGPIMTFIIILAGFCNTMVIKAEVESMALGNCECPRHFHVTGQIDVGGFCCGIVGDLTRTVPSCPGNRLTGAGMVADVGMCLAADGVAVPLHFRRGGGDHHAEQGTQAQGQGQE